MDLLDFAMKMETEGKAYYQQLADRATFPGLKNIFNMLAQEEQNHYDIFSAMKMGAPPVASQSTVLEYARSIFDDLAPEEQFEKRAVVANDIELEAYEHAMRLEDESVRLYTDMLKKETDPAVKTTITRVIDEERRHYNVMENIYDFVLRPHYFLQWREFTNLTELM